NGTYAYDLEGTLLWSIDLGDMRSRRGFGEASSPTLAGDLLIINWDHEDDSFIVALDKKSGREVWRTERPGEVSSWSTPLAVRHGGGLQIVVSSTGKSRGYEVETGEELWRLGGMTVNQIPTPLFRDGVIYLASGYRGSMLQAIDADRARGDLEGSEAVLWTYERDTPYVATPLLYGQNLYFVKHFRNVLTVLDPVTGDVRYGPVRLAGLGDIYASPVAAAGRVYFFDRRGRALVLRNGPSLEVIESNEIAENVDGTPALVGKWMYLRSRGSLYAFRDDAGE
ncbi:MAG: PQQ-binding-like beta-propeller repeat protein, partial [Acidobacteriota bacterium]|nr:PQQ-binding-like beta-propeller repeat protein [Acidobacteriota bacterium]